MSTIKESSLTLPVTSFPSGVSTIIPPPVCGLQSVFDLTTTQEALDYIDRSFPPAAQRHLALGYIHRLLASQHSAVRLVAQIIIPWLAQHNYRDLVLEILPRGNPDSPIEREIRHFNRTGEIRPEMQRFIFVVDQVNFVALLQAAYSAGIRIHSGGMSYRTAQALYSHPHDPVIRARGQREIAANSERAIREIQASGLNSASLNGLLHNDINPPPDHSPAVSFGHTLVSTPPRIPGRRPFAYAEIELVIPELVSVRYNYTDLPLPSGCTWDQFTPPSGVRLLGSAITSSRRSRYGTFLIHYPRTSTSPTP
jgi:hypothetical protein